MCTWRSTHDLYITVFLFMTVALGRTGHLPLLRTLPTTPYPESAYRTAWQQFAIGLCPKFSRRAARKHKWDSHEFMMFAINHLSLAFLLCSQASNISCHIYECIDRNCFSQCTLRCWLLDDVSKHRHFHGNNYCFQIPSTALCHWAKNFTIFHVLVRVTHVQR